MSILKFLRGHVPVVIAILCLLGVQAFCNLSLPRYMSQIVNEGVVLAQGGSSSYLAQMAGIMVAFCLASLAAAGTAGFLSSRLGAKVAHDLRHRIFAKVMSFSPAEVDRFSQASLITRCTNDVQQIQNMLIMLMRMVMMAPMMAVIAIVQVVFIGGGLAWIIAAAVIVVLGIVAGLFMLTAPRFRIMQSLVDRVNLLARELLDGLITIRAFGRETFSLEKFDNASLTLKQTQLFVNRCMMLMQPLLMFVMNGVTLLIVWFGAQQMSAGAMQVGDIMAFISYAMQIVMSFLMVAMVSVILPRAEVSVHRIDEVLDTKPAITEPDAPETVRAEDPHGQLVFDHVSFAYPGAEGNVISDVSFSCAPGKVTAIVGSTGSGKSTLVQLAPRLYDPTEGRVELDGHDVRNLALADVRKRVGYVPQQSFLFSGTIRSNVAFAAPDAEEHDLDAAIGTAQATELVKRSAEGLDEPIAQGGTNISGGQRQRLSIARALAAEPEVLVLDDSSSALDYATDASLRHALAHDVPNTAILIVAQRVATVMHADTIIVLDEGRVVGHGTHEELLATCPVYLEIAKSQMSASELGLKEEA